MTDNLPPLPNWLSQPPFRDDVIAYARAAIDAALGAVPAGWVLDIEDLKDRLVAISSAVADSDDRGAQAIIRTTLELLAAAPQQVAQPMTDAQKLATAIAEAATKVGITDASIHSFSGPQLLMLLDDMVEMAQAKPEQAAQPSEPMLDCDVVPRPLSYPLKDYHHSTTDGPLHSTWKDKPHRIVYDLIAAVRFYSQAKPEQAVQLPSIDEIAQFIRYKNGASKCGAGTLAEHLHEWLTKKGGQR